jgi:hypothetical protein
MPNSTAPQNDESPERLIAQLVRRLRTHALRDSLLIFCPPLIATLYILAFLHRASWMPPFALLSAAVAAISIGSLAVILRCRPRVPTADTAARLVDEKAAAQDRFVTLATLGPSSRSGALFQRLRREAARLVPRVQIRRDFPYHVKPSFYRSAIISLVIVGVFQFFLPFAQSSLSGSPSGASLVRELAQRMAQKPQLSELASRMKILATRLEDRKVPAQERQALIRETEKKVQQQLQKEEQGGTRDLLRQAAGTLKGLEKESGGTQGQEQEKGGGGVQSNLPQKGEGDRKPGQAGGSNGLGERNAQLNQEMQKGNPAESNSKEKGKERTGENQGNDKGHQPDRNTQDANKPGAKKDEQTGSTAQASSEEKVGKNKQSEEIPQGAPPAERYYRPGEQGREGIKGARYVTVQLPEEVAADAKGEITGTKESKERKSRPRVPVSNVPLPAHVPDAPTEKQPMPLEYRDLIR